MSSAGNGKTNLYERTSLIDHMDYMARRYDRHEANKLFLRVMEDLLSAEQQLDKLRCKECGDRFDDDGQCECLEVQDCCGELPELCTCENKTPEIEIVP